MDKRIGAQFYTIREFCKDAESLRESMKKVAEIGYKTVQISGVGPIPPETIREYADEFGLEILVTHRPADEYENHLDELIRYHKVLGCKYAGLGCFSGEHSMEGAKVFVEKYKPIAKKLAENGITFMYHNHALEFYKENGVSIMDYMIENTDPDNFKFLVDTYWVATAGVDVVEFLEKLGSRAPIVHFKDRKACLGWDPHATMCEVGEGNLNWDKIIATCEKIGTEYALVEQDKCECDPFDALKTSYDYLTKKGFC